MSPLRTFLTAIALSRYGLEGNDNSVSAEEERTAERSLSEMLNVAGTPDFWAAAGKARQITRANISFLNKYMEELLIFFDLKESKINQKIQISKGFPGFLDRSRTRR